MRLRRQKLFILLAMQARIRHPDDKPVDMRGRIETVPHSCLPLIVVMNPKTEHASRGGCGRMC